MATYLYSFLLYQWNGHLLVPVRSKKTELVNSWNWRNRPCSIRMLSATKNTIPLNSEIFASIGNWTQNIKYYWDSCNHQATDAFVCKIATAINYWHSCRLHGDSDDNDHNLGPNDRIIITFSKSNKTMCWRWAATTKTGLKKWSPPARRRKQTAIFQSTALLNIERRRAETE